MPTLTSHPRLRVLIYWIYYFFFFGIAVGLFTITLPVYLAAHGVNAGGVGFTLLMFNLPLSLLFFVAIIVDKYTNFTMGRRRFWIIISLILNMCVLCLMLVPFSFLSYPYLLGILLFAYNFTMVIGTVAFYAQAIELTPETKYNSVASYILNAAGVGYFVGAVGLGTILTNYANGWNLCIGIMLICTFLIFLAFLLVRENVNNVYLSIKRENKNIPNMQEKPYSIKGIIKDLWHICTQRYQAIFIVYLLFFCGITAGYIYAFTPVLAVNSFKWTDAAYTQIIGVITPIMYAFGPLIGGYMAVKLGNIKTLIIMISFYSIAFAVIAFSHQYWLVSYFASQFFIILMNGTFDFSDAVNWTSINGICMEITNKKISATHFNFLTSLQNLSIALGSGVYALLGGILTAKSGFYFILLFNILTIGILLILAKVMKGHIVKV